MKHNHSLLMWKLLLLYFGIMFFGVVILTLSNLFILGRSFRDLLWFNIWAVLIEAFIAALIFQFISFLALRHTREILKGEKQTADNNFQAWNEMVHLPARLYRSIVYVGIAASLLYHMAELLPQWGTLTMVDAVVLIGAVPFEQALSLTMAIMIFAFTRRLLRPYILKIPGIAEESFSKTTLYNSLLLSFISLLTITVCGFLWYNLMGFVNPRTMSLEFLLFLSLFVICLGIVVYTIFIREIKDDFAVLIDAMTSLLKGSRVQLKTKVPVVSSDEIGQLGLIFNQLQEKVSREYDDIESELKLASSVQQKLLPYGEQIFGPYKTIGVCKPSRDVGGDLFDIIQLDNDRFTVVIGDVIGKGMPASLVMSAVLLLFRNEIRNGGTAAEIMNRLNRMISGLNLNDACLTLGIAIFDTANNKMQYSSAGHVAPYIFGLSGLKQLLCSSLPLGVAEDEVYDQVECDINANDRLIFYTDGIIDAFYNKNGSGFDAFEKILTSMEDSKSIEHQLEYLVNRIETEGTSAYEDDKTLVMVELTGVGQQV